MKIRFFINDILQSESIENGFVVMVGLKSMSMFKLLGDEMTLISPYEDKEILLPNGNKVRMRISRSKIFDDAREKMSGYKGLTLVEFRVENAKLEIEW